MDRPDKRRRIVVIANFYLPGSKSGGGTRTIVNTVERLSDRYEFHIITRGYDAGEKGSPYKEVALGEWNDVGKAKVFYLKKHGDLRNVLEQTIEDVKPSLIYANSFFSDLTVRALGMRRLGRLSGISFIVAPCGELSSGALGLKSLKKRAFLRSAIISGLYDGLYWKASSKDEAMEFRELGVKDARIMIAPDMPPAAIFKEFSLDEKPDKRPGDVKLIFLSRFDRKKNLKWFADIVRLSEGRASMDVFGNIEDDDYLDEFKTSAESGASGIEFHLRGPLDHSMVPASLFERHFFVLPTLGENFGHVFLEALAAGCPLIISDRTPWNDLIEAGAGWSIPLESPDEWNRVLEHCVRMDDAEYRKMSGNARKYAERFLSDPGIESATVDLFEAAIENTGSGLENVRSA